MTELVQVAVAGSVGEAEELQALLDRAGIPATLEGAVEEHPEEHGDVAGAVAAFRRDASISERRAVRREWNAYRADTAGATLKAVGGQLSKGLGSAWVPRRRAELEALDALLSGLR